jgi:hypothetical protein
MHIPDAVRTLERDLRNLFGARLQSLVVYRAADDQHNPEVPTLAVLNELTADDLRACASRVAAWHDSGLATPLVLRAEEFGRSLDAFPFEFGAILADHAVVAGTDPFDGLRVDPAHLRHACEVQARSHLLHLREGYIETAGRSDALADLLTQSIPPLTALLKSIARLLGDPGTTGADAAQRVEQAAGLMPGSLGALVSLPAGRPVSGEDARRLVVPYLDNLEKLARFVDRWGPRG